MRRLLVPWLIVLKVLSALRQGTRFDVVEIHEPLSGPYSLVSRLFKRQLPPCAALSHGLEDRGWQAQLTHLRSYGRKPPLRTRVLVPLTLLSQARLGLRNSEAILVVSSVDRDHLVQHLRIPRERVSCAFGGVTARLFEVQSREADHARLLFIGSWIERKGTHELVEAWSRLQRARPTARLTLAGVGDADAAREQTRGLSGVDVIAQVRREELPGLLAAHDVFVLPSWFEGLPLAMLEAAAAGLACVVCAVCGNLDVFRPDDPRRDGALLIQPSDADSLYDALVALVDDPELRTTLGSRARERAREFSWARNATHSLDAYRAAVERRMRRCSGTRSVPSSRSKESGGG
jgi:glycosyltransferase involved in cell wall biosynthesis